MEPTKQAEENRSIEAMRTQLLVYEQLNGTFPSTEQGIKALVEKPAGEPVPRRWRKLFSDLPVDSWGNSYQLEVPNRRSKKDHFDVYSKGPDGKAGTDDDIGNW